MKEELYLKNLDRNKKIILSSKLDSHIVPIKKYDRDEFIITKDNVSKINDKYLKKINFKNKRIIVDSSMFNIFDLKDIEDLEKNINKSKFKNIYLDYGNELVQECFDKIIIILNYIK